MLENPHAMADFRTQYRISDTVEVRLNDPKNPFDGLFYTNDWMSFWLVTMVEGGV